MTPAFYLASVTMHGTIMVFFVLTTLLTGGFGNFLIPLQINEFLAFYLQFVVFDAAVPANGITIGGYYVLSTGVPGSTGFGSPTANGPKIFRLTQ